MESYSALPTVVTWLSVNLRGQTKRAVGVSAEIGIGNFGGVRPRFLQKSPEADKKESLSQVTFTARRTVVATSSVMAPTLACSRWASSSLRCTPSSSAESTKPVMSNTSVKWRCPSTSARRTRFQNCTNWVTEALIFVIPRKVANVGRRTSDGRTASHVSRKFR